MEPQPLCQVIELAGNIASGGGAAAFVVTLSPRRPVRIHYMTASLQGNDASTVAVAASARIYMAASHSTSRFFRLSPSSAQGADLAVVVDTGSSVSFPVDVVLTAHTPVTLTNYTRLYAIASSLTNIRAIVTLMYSIID